MDRDAMAHLAELDKPPARKTCRVCGVDTGAVEHCPRHVPAGRPATPPLTLSLEEIEALAKLDAEVDARQTIADAGNDGFYTQVNYATEDLGRALAQNSKALLSMARRLLELESAGEHLAQSDRRVVLVVDYRAPGEATYDCRARCLPQVAEMLGWDPTKAGR